MEQNAYIESVRRDGDRVVAAAGLGLQQMVPSCPEWMVEDLVAHLGGVHRWVAGILTSQAQERPASRPEPDGEDVVAWFKTGLDLITDALASTPPETQVWNWAGEPPRASFWSRRMAHETAVHRWDAQNAHGTIDPFDPAMASDAIAEMLEIVLVRIAQWKSIEPITGSLHVHCTDVDGEWFVSMQGKDITVTREHAKGDVAWRGAAGDLLLATSGRVPAAINTGVEIIGDRDISQRWTDALQF